MGNKQARKQIVGNEKSFNQPRLHQKKSRTYRPLALALEKVQQMSYFFPTMNFKIGSINRNILLIMIFSQNWYSFLNKYMQISIIFNIQSFIIHNNVLSLLRQFSSQQLLSDFLLKRFC